MADEPLLNEEDAAKLLHIARRTLQDWRFRGIGPRFVRMGRRTIRYRPQDIRGFLEKGMDETNWSHRREERRAAARRTL